MSEGAAASKNKKIAKAGPGRQVRLYVRAKFLSFRRYFSLYAGRKLPRTPTRPSSVSKASMTALLLHTTSERELLTSTKLTQARLRTDSE